MAKPKYYAIKVGRKRNIIVDDWIECEALVNGYPNARFKGFPTPEKATAWLKDHGENLDSQFIHVYVDGCYVDGEATWAFAVVINDQVTYSESGRITNQAALAIRNVAGELAAAMRATIWANGEPIVIVHDYDGTAAFVRGEFAPGNEFTKQYRDFMKKYPNVIFKHVKGHSGDRFNDLVDRMAYDTAKEWFNDHREVGDDADEETV